VAHYLVHTRREVPAVDVSEADGNKPTLKPELDELKTPTSAPNLEDTDGESPPTILVKPMKESEVQEKGSEIQYTLLSAGWRSRRGASAGSKGREKPVNPSSGQGQPNVLDNEDASEMNAEEPPPQKRRGRPLKNRPSGKAAFYGSAPKAPLDAKPEPVDGDLAGRILVLDSDTDDSSDRPSNAPETIAHRLRRRVTS